MDDEARALLATFIEKITDTVKNLHDAVTAQESRLDRLESKIDTVKAENDQLEMNTAIHLRKLDQLEQKFIQSLDAQLHICDVLKEMNK